MNYAISVNRGRVAIEVALKALEVTDSDEVIIPSYVCGCVLEAVHRAGARPVFADIGIDLHLNSETIQSAITDRTKCVIVPHLYGNTAPIDEIEKMLCKRGIALIDDAAQSFGAYRSGRLVGSFGSFGVVSCGPGKSLAGSAGGLLVTNDSKLYQKALAVNLQNEKPKAVFSRVTSFWFWRRFRKYTLLLGTILDRIGLFDNRVEETVAARMSNLEGAIALNQFFNLKANFENRRHNAEIILELLGKYSKYTISDLSKDSMLLKLVLQLNQFEITVDMLLNLLLSKGIEAQRGQEPLHFHDSKVCSIDGMLPETEKKWRNIVCIPLETKYV